MVLFAGPVFTEWYWGPIFFTIVCGPPLLAVALVVDRVVRRRLTTGQRAALAAGVVVGGALCIIGGRSFVEAVRFDRQSRAEARSFDFQPYAPSPLPGTFDTELAEPFDRALISRYGAGPGAYAFAYQQKPGEVSLRDGRCALRQLIGTGTSFFDGPCRRLRTPRGRDVFIGVSKTLLGGGEAFALLDGTLVRMQLSQVADRDVLAYYDSLRPVAAGELEFKRG